MSTTETWDILTIPPRLGLPFRYDDGGRSAAGFRGSTGDCTCRAIAIASSLPYREVYDALNALAKAENAMRPCRRPSRARTGVSRAVYDAYLGALGFTWVPTMGIGTGCLVHLSPRELPPRSRLVVRLSKHMTAVIDGEIRDTYDPSRGGTRCVYGYWRKG